MSTVEVIDDSGKSLGKVKVGDTKQQALERLSRAGAGGLYDKEDVGLLASDAITAAGGPYIFKATAVLHLEQPRPPEPEASIQQNLQLMIVRRSTEIRDSWCTRLDNVPDIANLPAVVQAELPRSLPSPYQPSSNLLDGPAKDVVSFAPHDVVTAELGNILTSIYSLPRCGDNEDSVHSLVDALVLRPIAIVGEGADCGFRVNRNGADYTGATVRNLRPDVLLWLPSGVLALKGEDKATAAERHLARNELLTKLNCFSEAFFGRVPYQICYNAGGTTLEFVAISRLTAGKPTLVSISPTVDLSTIRGRSLCVRFALNIARILVLLQEAYPEGSVVRLGDKVETTNSSVNVFGEYVIKETAHHSGDVLKELYAAIRQGQPPFLVSSPKDVKINRSGVLTVHLSLVGFCGKTPDGLAENGCWSPCFGSPSVAT